MSFTIRKMKLSDISSVQAIAKKTWNATYEEIIPSAIQEKFLNAAYSDASMEHRVINSLLLVAEVEGKVVGFANYSPADSDGKAELGAIYIDPANQGSGIGTAFLKEGISRLEGVKEVYINVERDNEIGHTFYNAKGFQVVDVFDDDFDGHILKTLLMVLDTELFLADGAS